VVSAWASEQGLVLGQRCVDGKSNEITAVPELLDQLALENSIVTLDAMGCQTAIAEKILARGGDYLLTLKGNHPLAHAAVVEHFDQRCFRVGAPSRADCDAFDDTHGRLVRRRVFASTNAAALEALSGWPGLRTVLAVESIRSVNSAPTKVESEIRYFLSSCPDDPAVLGKAIRSHWAVENALHWVLDVTFREDDSRVRDRTAARNLALLRKIALNIVGRDKTAKASVRARRKKAAWNDAYMLKLLARIMHRGGLRGVSGMAGTTRHARAWERLAGAAVVGVGGCWDGGDWGRLPRRSGEHARQSGQHAGEDRLVRGCLGQMEPDLPLQHLDPGGELEQTQAQGIELGHPPR
jgi:predicted transposase YbfD/YdcC